MKFQEVRDYVLNSQVKSRDIEILNIYGLKRDAEHQVWFLFVTTDISFIYYPLFRNFHTISLLNNSFSMARV